MILLDNCILSSLAKIQKLNLLRHFGEVCISSGVFEEALHSGVIGIEKEIKHALGFWLSIQSVDDRLKIHELKDKNPMLSDVDCELIYLAKNLNCRILTDDRALGEIAKSKFNIDIFDLESILLTLKAEKIITTKDLKKIIIKLEKKDAYKFAEEKKKILLE